MQWLNSTDIPAHTHWFSSDFGSCRFRFFFFRVNIMCADNHFFLCRVFFFLSFSRSEQKTAFSNPQRRHEFRTHSPFYCISNHYNWSQMWAFHWSRTLLMMNTNKALSLTPTLLCTCNHSHNATEETHQSKSVFSLTLLSSLLPTSAIGIFRSALISIFPPWVASPLILFLVVNMYRH